MARIRDLNTAHIRVNEWADYHITNGLDDDGVGYPPTTTIARAIDGAIGVQLCAYFTCQSREPVGARDAMKPKSVREVDEAISTMPREMLTALIYRYFAPGLQGQRVRMYRAATGLGASEYYKRVDQALVWVGAHLAAQRGQKKILERG